VKRLRVDQRGGSGAFGQQSERIKAKESEEKQAERDSEQSQGLGSN
jgi:hypothetical protein